MKILIAHVRVWIMKKLINDPDKVTVESIEGFALAYPQMVKQVAPHVIARKNAPIIGKVGVVVGGGSGHEPLFLGWVGSGMADSAVLGEVFASPAPPLILQAAKAANGGRGLIFIYGNYAGDNMNFDIASSLAEESEMEVEQVRVWDDVASAPPDRCQERRGLAADFFVIKVAGAMAETGASLSEVKRVAEKARDASRTFAVALSPATVPSSGRPTFMIGENEVYFGIGAHGERGVRKTPLLSADETAKILTAEVIGDLSVKNGEEVNLLVNGYGSTTLMELYIMNRKVNTILKGKGIRIHRTEVGNFLTTQEMAGCSVTMMRVDDELRKLCDAPAVTSAYRL